MSAHQRMGETQLRLQELRLRPMSGVRFHTQAARDNETQSATDQRSEFRVRTETLTLGADKRLSDAFAVGASLALGNGRTRFLGNQSRQKIDDTGLTGYANWSVSPSTYLAATLSHDWNKFSLERDGGSGSVARASTKGTATGFGLSGGYDHVRGPWTVSPYARWDALVARVRAFDEYGSADAVSVGAQRMRSQSVNLGVNAQYSISQEWGVLLPYARVELTNRRDKAPSGASSRLLSDNTALLIPTAGEDNRHYGAWALGLNAITLHGYSLFLDYQAGFNLKGYRTQHVTLGIRFEL